MSVSSYLVHEVLGLHADSRLLLHGRPQHVACEAAPKGHGANPRRIEMQELEFVAVTHRLQYNVCAREEVA